MNTLFVAAMGVLVCLSLSCKEEIVVSSQDSLVDARIAPKLIFTSPPMNSVGPYAGWGEYPSYDYSIIMRFNKLMDIASVRAGLRISSPIRRLKVSGSYYPQRQISESYTLVPVDSGWSDLRRPQLGEVLTLQVVTPIADVNGNVIPAGLIGTMVPETAFRVMGIDPRDGEVLQPYAKVTIAFNSPVDTSIFSSISVQPGIDLHWSLNPYNSTLVQSSALEFPAGSFTLSVASGGRDRAGHVMPAGYSSVVWVQGLELTENTFQYGDTDLPLFENFMFNFSQPLNALTVASALHLSPSPIKGMSVTAGYSSITVVPYVNLAASTIYTLTIDTTLRSIYGQRLSHTRTFVFTTGPFSVHYADPRNGATNVSTTSDLIIHLNGWIDSSTIRGAFTISPAVDGIPYSPQLEPYTLVFALADSLRSNTTYTVALDTTLRSTGGYRLLHPETITFTTRSY